MVMRLTRFINFLKIENMTLKQLDRFYPLPYLLRSWKRKQLLNKDFTIFASNCIGGIIYHLLEEKFLSPTVNLRISSNYFVKFLLNIEHYLSAPLDFDKNANTPYPMGILDDIPIHFNHYHTEEDAFEKWESRKKRINWNNVYVMLNDLDGVTKDDIIALKDLPCQNIIIFTHNRFPNIPYTHYVGNQDKLSKILIRSKITGLYNFETWFDYVGFLNHNVPILT